MDDGFGLVFVGFAWVVVALAFGLFLHDARGERPPDWLRRTRPSADG